MIRDFGVFLDYALTFHLHNEDIINRTIRILGIMFWITWDFNDPTA